MTSRVNINPVMWDFSVKGKGRVKKKRCVKRDDPAWKAVAGERY